MAGNTPICVISATGLNRPTFAACQAYFTGGFQIIYGSDVYLGNDCQDGQYVGLLATALDDCNGEAVACYNSFIPDQSVGTGLSSLVKLNGIARFNPSYSTAPVVIIGQGNTDIINGYAVDPAGNQWALPPLVTIPGGGEVDSIVTCATQGAIQAAPGDISTIGNAQLGWQSITNTTAAIPGAPVETDGQLRARRDDSTELSALSMLQALQGGLEAIAGNGNVWVYQNDTAVVNALGIPANCIACVINNLSVTQALIGGIIYQYKPPGMPTFGNTSIIVNDPISGVPDVINYSTVTPEQILVTVQVHPLNGWSTTIQTNIANAIAAWINALPPGTGFSVSDLFMPSLVNGSTALGFGTYSIPMNGIAAAISPATPGVADIAVAYNQQCAATESPVGNTTYPGNVTFTLI